MIQHFITHVSPSILESTNINIHITQKTFSDKSINMRITTRLCIDTDTHYFSLKIMMWPLYILCQRVGLLYPRNHTTGLKTSHGTAGYELVIRFNEFFTA